MTPKKRTKWHQKKEPNDTEKKNQMDFFGSVAVRNLATLINTTERGHAPKAKPEKPLIE